MTVSKWVLGAAAVGLATAGTLATLSGASEHRKLDDAVRSAGSGVASLTQNAATELQDNGRSSKTLGAGLYVTGAVALAASATFFVLDAQDAGPGFGVSVAPSATGGSIFLRGRF